MTPDVVVDIGNSRIKWGWGQPLRMASLPPDDEAAWDRQLAELGTSGPLAWAVAGVHPARLDRFAAWATARGDHVRVITHADIPLTIDVDEPAKVGIDRLLGAVAARHRTPAGSPCVAVDVGTAVTVNLIDAGGTFQGGAIFPGPHLMALALNRNTAALPPVEVAAEPAPPPVGRNTAGAIRSGVAAAVQGGVGVLVTRFAVSHPWPYLFLTGGGLGSLGKFLFREANDVIEVPELNLEGIRIVAEGLP
ncbi:MAG: type III pantothenate kinase [Gemmataceae bacterium]|nr:type III pantothenate kinase [Gemmataceae bacterium]